jgi:hypothetical protein|tara:strand:- start:82 stop:984 length:903 start_codon:yes stop_codon:yes gene_type:complete
MNALTTTLKPCQNNAARGGRGGVKVASSSSLPQRRRFIRRHNGGGMCGALGKSSTVSHYPKEVKEEQRDEKDASTSDVALNPPVRRRRAVMVGVARSVLFGAAACVLAESFVREDVQASEDVEDETVGAPLNEYTFKTFTLRAPGFYKEVDVDYDKGRLSGANGLELLIRDSRFGLAGNTITLSKQGSPIDPNTKQPLFSKTEDLGDVDAVAEKLVAGENQRNKGANAILKESKKGTVDGTTYYDVSYTKKVKFVDRIVRTRVCVHDNVLFTLTVETDLERGTGEEAQSLDDIVTSFRVL